MNDALDVLLRRSPLIWRGESGVFSGRMFVSGFNALDAILPGGGWPGEGLIEVVAPVGGVGEIGLFLPLMAASAQVGRRIAWVAPPHLPYPPSLADAGVDPAQLALLHLQADKERLWAAERLLRSGSCGLVLLWPDRIDHRQMRRLQVAAVAGHSLGAVFRRQDCGGSPAPLRLSLMPEHGGLRVQVLKARSGATGRTAWLAV